MGKLAKHLAEQFAAIGLTGWHAEPEAALFSKDLERRYGFRPRVDVLFRKKDDSSKRLFVELEVSRADPVANQVKFLLAREAHEVGPDDVLVSMFSTAIERGRRNVCGVFAGHLRASGVAAFQLSLLPWLEPDEVRRLNKSDAAPVERGKISVESELDRVSSVVEPRGDAGHRIHFAGDVSDVLANVWTWNGEIAGPAAVHWGERHAQYFVHDPIAKQFAPSKFCAFLPAPRPNGAVAPPPTMTLALYATLGEEDPRFDGHRARKHLEQRLAFDCVSLEETDLIKEFGSWHDAHGERVSLKRPVSVLRPPAWYF
jgi:hypothetical protein